MKKLLLFNLVIVGLGGLITFIFPTFCLNWLTVSTIVFFGISLIAHMMYKFLSKEDNIMPPFFLSMGLRFLTIGIMTLFYVKVRNIPTLNYVGIIFIVYLFHLVFELKYILHNLREN